MESSKKNIKPIILKIFKELLSHYESLGKKGNYLTRFKIDSYRKAIKSIEDFKNPIYSATDVKDLPFIGKSFYEKINNISKTGTLNTYENIIKNTKYKSIKLFQSIWGIGAQYAQKIVNLGIFTINDLKKAIKNNKITLTQPQMLGLKYYNDLSKKIERNEITYYTEIIKQLIENDNIKVYNAGSYRSNKKYSGDIDLIISYNSKSKNVQNIFYEKLKEENIIRDVLSFGKEKNMFIVKLPETYSKNFIPKIKYYRKVDVAFVEEKYIPYYLLYFGSSRDFSKKIRIIASKLGYKLNEKGLYDKETGLRINFNPSSEKEIFTYLNIEYVKPENRV